MSTCAFTPPGRDPDGWGHLESDSGTKATSRRICGKRVLTATRSAPNVLQNAYPTQNRLLPREDCRKYEENVGEAEDFECHAINLSMRNEFKCHSSSSASSFSEHDFDWHDHSVGSEEDIDYLDSSFDEEDLDLENVDIDELLTEGLNMPDLSLSSIPEDPESDLKDVRYAYDIPHHIGSSGRVDAEFYDLEEFWVSLPDTGISKQSNLQPSAADSPGGREYVHYRRESNQSNRQVTPPSSLSSISLSTPTPKRRPAIPSFPLDLNCIDARPRYPLPWSLSSQPLPARHSRLRYKQLRNADAVSLPGQVRYHGTERKSRSQSPTTSRKGSAWSPEDDEDLPCDPLSPTIEVTAATQPSPQLYYTTPPQSQMATTLGWEERRSRLERSGSAKGGFSRLARRLSHKERRNNEERKKALRQRSVSLDCGDGRRPLESPGPENQRPEERCLSIPASPSLPSKLGRRSGSSSPNLAGRLSRRASGNRSRRSNADTGEIKVSGKRKNQPDPQALFEAVEQQDMEATRILLDTSSLDINCVNSDDLTPLDVAVLTNHVPMARMLLAYGARENPKFEKAGESRSLQLSCLVSDVEQRLQVLATMTDTQSGQTKENEKLFNHWEYRYKLLKRMQAGYDHTSLPDPPNNINLTVSSSSSLLVSFDEPENQGGAVVTRYKVEWSCFEDFSVIAGEQLVEDVRYRMYEIPDLVTQEIYYVRVRSGNIKGFGPSAQSNPSGAAASSWRQLTGAKPRQEGKLELLQQLFTNIRNSRPPDAPQIRDPHVAALSRSPLHGRRSNMRKSLKNLFTSSPKFQKTLRRGVYLACLLYNEDRVLVTNEENLPIIEVDENFSGTSLYPDFHWMMKVACTWEDVKSLRHDMDKTCSSGNLVFRSKLLSAASQLQSALGVQDLGQFYHKPTRDMNGSTILTTVNHLRDPKVINSSNGKWMPLSKLQKKIVALADNVAAPEMLLSSLSELISYQQSSSCPLPRGLYLGYLKLKSSVDLIHIMVPSKTPNVLPHIRIRDCPHVSREEWEWIQMLSNNEVSVSPSLVQTNFQQSLVNACKTLLSSLGVDEAKAVTHRVYDCEVMELSDDITFLLVLPPVENVCSIPGHTEQITENPNFTTLPVQVFEIIHMLTYQHEFIHRYSRLSAILEMATQMAQQSQREAFSNEELSSARERVDQLACFQQQLDETWKGMRWTMDIITFGRDKALRGGLPLGVLYAPPPSPQESPLVPRKDLDIAALSSNNDLGYQSDRSSGDIGTGEGSECTDGSTGSDVWSKPACCQAGVLRVYAAYETGLAKGTSVKLHVSARTTSREVVHLVVQQLNKAVVIKGCCGPLYSDEQLEEFCLVAVVGARERVLRDDFQPLQLQNPWVKGRLYVRLKTDLLAALEHGHMTSV